MKLTTRMIYCYLQISCCVVILIAAKNVNFDAFSATSSATSSEYQNVTHGAKAVFKNLKDGSGQGLRSGPGSNWGSGLRVQV